MSYLALRSPSLGSKPLLFLAFSLTAALPAAGQLRHTPGLTSARFLERTGPTTVKTFAADSVAMTTRLPDPLGPANSDFTGLPNEYYDVFYSTVDGVFDLDGDYITIECRFDAEAGGGNIDEVYLDFADGSHLCACAVTESTYLGTNFIPGSAANAADCDEATTSTMGHTANPGERLSITVDHFCCVAPPPQMIAWWPLDETTGTTAAELISGLDGVHQGTTAPEPVEGMVESGLYFDNSSPNSGTSWVAAPGGIDPDLGTQDFSIDAWVFLDAGQCQSSLVSKGASYFSQDEDPAEVGFEWGVIDGYAYLLLSNDTTSFHFSSAPNIAGTLQWHHLAVTVGRNATTPPALQDVIFYLDGVAYPDGLQTAPLTASLTTAEPLYLSRFGGQTEYLNPLEAGLDEVEIFDRALTPEEVRALYEARWAGKCKVQLYVPDVTFCREDPVGTMAKVKVTVVNDTLTEQCYELSCIPLPVGPGCSAAGPTVFDIPTLGYCIPARDQLTTTLEVGCPPGLGSACFRVIATSPNGESWSQKVRVTRRPCDATTFEFSQHP